MGLDTTHDCWHGAYSAFMRWRQKIAEVAGLPPLMLMDGFYRDGALRSGNGGNTYAIEECEQSLPIKWEALRPSPLHILLNHSDCDGSISANDCGPIADALEALLPKLEAEGNGGGHIGGYAEKTRTFIAGLRFAASRGEDVEFH